MSPADDVQNILRVVQELRSEGYRDDQIMKFMRRGKELYEMTATDVLQRYGLQSSNRKCQ